MWIDALRGANTERTRRFRDVARQQELVITDAVAMEVLAGTRTDRERLAVEATLGTRPRIPTEQFDFDAAATIYRACRRRGATPRSLIDCLIAAVAMRVDAAVLHSDRDFDLIAEHVGLRVDRP